LASLADEALELCSSRLDVHAVRAATVNRAKVAISLFFFIRGSPV
jgi:hypothetical protein